jgi:hypothetical protein
MIAKLPGTPVASDTHDRVLATELGGTIRLWEPDTGRALGTIPDRMGAGVDAAAMSDDGAWLAVVTAGAPIRIWDLRGEAAPPAAIDAFVRCRAPFRLDGARLVPAEPSPIACRGTP